MTRNPRRPQPNSTPSDVHTGTRRTTRLVRSGVIAATLITGLSACGNSADPVAADAPSDEPGATPVVTVPIEVAVTEAPILVVPTTSPVTAPPVTVGTTPELVAFGDDNSALVTEWSTQLNTFGDQVMEYLADVSAAPAAPATMDLCDQIVAAIGTDTTDTGLITLRDFAFAMSAAIGFAKDGDQESALSVFLTLQAQAEQFTAVMDQIRV